MLSLPEVTVWTMVWNDDRRWIVKAGQVLRYCAAIIQPARFILFTHDKIAPREYPWDTVQIPQLNWQSYNIFVNRVIPTYIKSQFAMSVHEDGFPIAPELWEPAFLEYDYIGAPWSDGVVGNGGFNIESRKLMDLKCAMPVTQDDFTVPSDRLVCSARRPWLEEQGVRFAPPELAARFSTEQVGNDQPSFGFHGRQVAAAKYRQGWSLVASTRITQHNGFTLERNKVVKSPRLPAAVPQPGKPQPLALATLPPASEMKVTVVYVYPLVAGQKYHNYAGRFVDSYRKNPAGAEHELLVVLNGGTVTKQIAELFGGLPQCRFVQHDNSGYDLGAFQKVSKQCQSDLIVFFGASTYLNGAGWLTRMVEAAEKHGYALYGAMGNRGDARYRVWPHIRTTAFWMPPSLLNGFPRQIRKPQDRHGFEHGPDCFTGWANKHGVKAWVVTWKNEFEEAHWDDDPTGFQRGDQSGLLAGDHISEPPYYQPK